MGKKRQLAAILYAELVGFTSFIHADVQTEESVRSRIHECFSKIQKDHQAVDAQQLGDANVLVFRSTAAAVEAAYALQRAFLDDPEIPFRMGIHSGEIARDDRGIYGGGIRLAARLAREATVGSILYSGKVYDDVKNHPWLQSSFFDRVSFDDLGEEMDLYFVANQDVRRPLQKAKGSPQVNFDPDMNLEPSFSGAGKKKAIAAILALLFGCLGLHRFYLDQQIKGLIQLTIFGLLLFISSIQDAPLVLFTLIPALMDAILFMVMPRRDFDRKYNADVGEHLRKKPKRISDKSIRHLKKGLRRFEQGSFRRAIESFDTALEYDPDSYAGHYHLARCFAMLVDHDHAFHHLQQALALGFSDIGRMLQDHALDRLRSDARFEALISQAKHGYSDRLPAPTPDLLSSSRSSLIHQLEKHRMSIGNQTD